MQEWFSELGNAFVQTFISDDRWQIFLRGFGVTIRTAVLALLIGIVLGVLVAIVRTQHDSRRSSKKGPGTVLLNILDAICRLYLTVIRGTPMMVQLMIMYFVIFASTRRAGMVAILAFGINSGAYVAEIVRGGIMSVDQGQMEAGRSLGMNYKQTMRHIIIPQAIKNILPAIANEFVVIIKESAVTYTIGVQDIMSAVNVVKGSAYVIVEPLLVATAIYFCLCFPTSKIIAYIERRMSRGDKR